MNCKTSAPPVPPNGFSNRSPKYTCLPMINIFFFTLLDSKLQQRCPIISDYACITRQSQWIITWSATIVQYSFYLLNMELDPAENLKMQCPFKIWAQFHPCIHACMHECVLIFGQVSMEYFTQIYYISFQNTQQQILKKDISRSHLF